MKKNSEKVKELVGISVLAAIVVVLQLISNFILPSNLPLTLALIPIVVGSIIYGPKGGFIFCSSGIFVTMQEFLFCRFICAIFVFQL